MAKISRITIYDKLETVMVPGANASVVKLKGVKGLDIAENGTVSVKISVPAQAKGSENSLTQEIKEKLKTVEGVTDVQVTLTVENKAHGQVEKVNLIPNVKYPIVVGSGKGGVGKSTVSVNLAIALAKLGYKVGLLDADLYGPSIPLMLGVDSTPEVTEDEKLKPIEVYGIKVMSLGFMLEDDTPVIWRGPLLIKALQQFLQDVEWGELDFLLTDLPPGTGDIQISMSQNVHVKGAIAVTTPQDVALLDVKKAITMFSKIGIPVLGVVENMSYFICPDCGSKHYIFSGEKSSTGDELKTEKLGQIPLTISIREGGDKGKPVIVAEPESEVSKAFMEAAKTITKKVMN